MADLLLELFSEEIPARMQAGAAERLSAELARALSENGYETAGLKTFVTPRRLAIHVAGLPAKQKDITTERKGPKTNAPDAAIQGFLKSTGLALKDLEEKGGVYFANIHVKGRATTDVLKEIIEKILSSFVWPKSMRDGADITWVRPLHNILCLFDGKVVPVEFGGLKANDQTFGHRFLAPKAITINDVLKYESSLEKAYVIANAEKRKAKIAAEAEKLVASHTLTLKQDEGLLSEVTGLVEWPVMLVGSIDDKYMHLPPEVLITVMRAHQKYFALHEKDGALSAKFLITANMETNDKGKTIIAGNERVLRARFADAAFFWEQDRKKPLADWAKGLSGMTYHAKLGSVTAKVERIKALAVLIAEKTGVDKIKAQHAAELCKADLTTGMVGEFPELQGVMGRYYALAQKQDSNIADAIRDHYSPLGPSDKCPAAPVSACIALADKLDTLISLFSIGEKPTGSKDPFALRRAALGVIRILLENKLRVPLSQLFKDDSLHAFLVDRLKVQLKDQGVRHDLISAVSALGEDDLVRLVARVNALQDFLVTDDGANLLVAYRRASNIVAIEEKKDGKKYDGAADKSLLKQLEESTLLDALDDIQARVEDALAQEDFASAMAALSALRAPVDSFFDAVLVNDKDAALRANRLKLLAHIKVTMDKVGDFSAIEGGDTLQKAA